MTRNPKKFLFDMHDACRFLIETTEGRTLDDYRSDRVFRSAVERELQNIGEALRQLEAVDPELARSIEEHDRIIRFRHVLVHGYDVVKPESVWDVLEKKLSPLRTQLEELLNA